MIFEHINLFIFLQLLYYKNMIKIKILNLKSFLTVKILQIQFFNIRLLHHHIQFYFHILKFCNFTCLVF